MDQKETEPPWRAKHASFRFNTIISLRQVKSKYDACALYSAKNTSRSSLLSLVEAIKLEFSVNYHNVLFRP